MRQSHLFTKTRKSAPKDEIAKNAQLLIRAGFIHKEMAGVYDFLPLGLRVAEKIKSIIREEMNEIGGQEMIMTSLQRKELWQQTDRWDDEKVDTWFKSELKSGGEVGLAWSHEEPITDMMKTYISSYRDLPKYVYQFQTKLRNEMRAKSGIMRSREFVMKDLYSYSVSDEAHLEFYEKVKQSYLRIFERVGLGDRTFVTFASGGAFTKFSHEFQTLSETGEDTIYLHRGKKLAINKEVITDEVMSELEVTRNELEESKAIEVGNIFSFGGTKSEQLGLYFKDENGETKPVILGSYGIGIGRLMGTIVEILSDEKGIVWPKEVSPYHAHLVSISGGDPDVVKEADHLYELFRENDIEVLYDDRDVRAGEKFADADLIGIPTRVIVSGKTMGEGGVEVGVRGEGNGRLVSDSNIIEYLKKN